MLSMTTPAVTAAEATAYLAAAGATDWTEDGKPSVWPEDAALQEQAIMRGQRAIASRYNGRWSDDLDPVPAPVTYAVIEAALIEAKTPGFFARTYTPSEAKVLVEVKGIRWERVGGSGMTPTSTIVDSLLAPYLGAAMANSSWLARA